MAAEFFSRVLTTTVEDGILSSIIKVNDDDVAAYEELTTDQIRDAS